MENSKLVRIPMSTRHKISKNNNSNEANHTTNISMIRKLKYGVHTRPDITLATLVWWQDSQKIPKKIT